MHRPCPWSSLRPASFRTAWCRRSSIVIGTIAIVTTGIVTIVIGTTTIATIGTAGWSAMVAGTADIATAICTGAATGTETELPVLLQTGPASIGPAFYWTFH